MIDETKFPMTVATAIGRLSRGAAPWAVAVALSSFGAAALAQQTAQTVQQADSGVLQEVVVTARYRTENLQTTPIAITALSVEDLEQRNFQNVDDLGYTIPNAYFRQPVSNFGPTETIGIRGLTQVDFNYAFQPTVGVYVDDSYHGTLTGSSMDLTDLERVEVLRGPQGTLFGINTMGGAIRLITKKPQGDDSGYVEATYGERNQVNIKAMGDFALIPESLFVRFSAVSRRQDGYGAHLDFACEMALQGTPALSGILPETINPKQGNGCALGGLGGDETQGARVALRYLAAPGLEFNADAYYSAELGEPPVQAFLTRLGGGGPTDGNSGTFGYDTLVVQPNYHTCYTCDNRMITGNPYTNYNTYGNVVTGVQYDPNTHLHAWGTSATMDWTITDKVHLKLIGSYEKYISVWDNDSDGTPFELIQTPNQQEHRQHQLESQLTGAAFNDKFNWTWGLFYYKSTSRAYSTEDFVSFNLNFISDDLFSNENKSTFLHASYKLTDKLSVSAGLRYSDDSNTNLLQHFGLVVLPAPLDYGGKHTSYKAGIDYQATDQLFVYGAVADGFTSAGVSPRPFTANQVIGLPGEEVVDYELGVKLELFDKRLRINSDVFYEDYKKRLANEFATECNLPTDATPGNPFFLAGGLCPAGTPAGDSPVPQQHAGTPWFAYVNQPAKIRGFESEITAFPVADLAINASVGYNRLKGNASVGSPVYLDPSFIAQPEWNASAGVQYGFRLANGARITPRLDYFFQSYATDGAPNTAQRTPDDIIPGYGIYNLRLAYDPPSASWQVAFTVSNLFNKFYWLQLGTATQANGAPAIGRVGTPSVPRVWGLTFRKNFEAGTK